MLQIQNFFLFIYIIYYYIIESTVFTVTFIDNEHPALSVC